jgi:hypothetical protein
MAGAEGFEPSHTGSKVPCLTAWLRPNNILVVERAGFEPAKALPADLQSAPFGQLGNLSSIGGPTWDRTRDRPVMSRLLYR